jgi:hypothetical protein
LRAAVGCPIAGAHSAAVGSAVDGGFIALAFGLCARMIIGMGQDLVEVGKVVNGMCDTKYAFGDSHGETAPVYGHYIGVELFDEGAVVHVDDLKFVVPKLGSA